MSSSTDIAAEARRNFEAGEYEACLGLIARLPNKTQATAHNAALCELALGRSHENQAFTRLRKLSSSGAGESLLVGYNLAVGLLHRGRYQEAATAALEVVRAWNRESTPRWVGVGAAFLTLEALLQVAGQPVASLEAGQPAFEFLDRNLGDYSKSWAQGAPVRAQEASWLLHVYRARFSLAKGSKKASKRETKAAHEAAQSLQDPHKVTALMLRSQLAMLRSDWGNASDTLASITQLPASSDGYTISDDAAVGTLYYNNLGVLNFRQKKFRAASFYFTKALTFNEKHHSSHQRTKLPTNPHSADKACDVLYNLGLSLLLTDRPQLAFECFQEALPGRTMDALMWLRLAECCISSHSQTVKAQRRQFKVTLGVESGKRDRSRMILPSGYATEPHFDDRRRKHNNRGNSSNNDDTRSGMSLTHAAECLRNALVLLRPGAQDDALRTYVLLDLAFVSLSLSDPMSAMVARQLIDAPAVSTETSNQARIYVAEALLMMNETDQALQLILQQALAERGGKNSSRLVLLTNLITIYILKDDITLAQQTLKRVMSLTSSPSSDLYLLQAYLSIRAGDLNSALQLLKRGRPLVKRK